MSRTAYFVFAVALGLFAGFWSMGFMVLYIGNGLGKDSAPGASFYDAGFIVLLSLWSGILLGIIWGSWACLKRAFRAPAKDLTSSIQEPSRPDKALKLPTPDGRLAHLIEKT